MEMDPKLFIALSNENKKEMLKLEKLKANLEFAFCHESDHYERSILVNEINAITKQQKSILEGKPVA